MGRTVQSTHYSRRPLPLGVGVRATERVVTGVWVAGAATPNLGARTRTIRIEEGVG